MLTARPDNDVSLAHGANALGQYVVVEWSGGGGIGHYAFLLADALAETHRQVVLATRVPHELQALPHRQRLAEVWPRQPSVRLTGRARRAFVAMTWLWGWFRLLFVLARLPRPKRRSVVHVQAPETTPEILLLAAVRLLGPTLVVTAHNALPHDYATRGRWMHSFTYRLPHGIVAQTDAEAETVRSITGRAGKVTAIPHGSYAPIVDALSPNPPTRADSDTRIVAAHLGSIRPYKGFDIVVEAFRRAREQDGRLELRVAGKPSDEAVAAGLLETLPAGSWSARLEYLTIEELVQEACCADVVLLGHRRASESGILHLALAAGAPVIGPDTAGIGRLLAAEPGWLYEPGDPTSAASALVALAAAIARDGPATRRMARALADRHSPPWSEVAAAHLRFVGALL